MPLSRKTIFTQMSKVDQVSTCSQAQKSELPWSEERIFCRARDEWMVSCANVGELLQKYNSAYLTIKAS